MGGAGGFWVGVIWDLRACVLRADNAESPQTPGGVNPPTPHRGETCACGVAGTNLWSLFSPAVLKQNTDFSFLHLQDESRQPELCLILEIRRDDAHLQSLHNTRSMGTFSKRKHFDEWHVCTPRRLENYAFKNLITQRKITWNLSFSQCFVWHSVWRDGYRWGRKINWDFVLSLCRKKRINSRNQ